VSPNRFGSASSTPFVALNDIRAAIRGREEEVLDALGIRWRDGKPHITCPYPQHRDSHPSWRWDERKARAYCTCIARSHSIFDVAAEIEGIRFEEAKIRVAELLNRPELIGADDSSGKAAANPGNSRPKLVPIVPVPDDARPFDWRHPQYGRPVATWRYCDAKGQLVAYAARVEYVEDSERRKAVYPVLWCRVEQNGREYCAWRSTGVPVPRSLYNLPVLLASPDALVVLVEGEKTADRVAELFPGCVGTTSMGGAKAASLTDWTPLAGRRVVNWPDNDDPGRAYATDVARILTAVPSASVAIVDVPQDWPEGWDLADEPPAGIGAESLARMLATAVPRVPDPRQPDKKRASKEEIEAAVRRLAGLSEIDIALEREDEARRLGIGAPLIDKLIKIERSNTDGGDGLAVPGQGRPIEIADVEPWLAEVDGAELLDETAKAVREYLILSQRQADALALWANFTHTFEAFDFSPKLVVRSPEKRSGKTRLVEVVERVARRPFYVSGISPAALLRVIEQHAPAMLLDEIDALMKGDAEMTEALRGMINSGFTRAGAQFVKNVPTRDGGFEPRAFSTWCPMLLAGIGSLPDTVADRSIIIEMMRKRPDERVKRLRARDGGELSDLDRKMALGGRQSRSPQTGGPGNSRGTERSRSRCLVAAARHCGRGRRHMACPRTTDRNRAERRRGHRDTARNAVARHPARVRRKEGGPSGER
jgi:hypothetical protein